MATSASWSLRLRATARRTFDPKIVAKGQTRWAGFDDKIISMYARRDDDVADPEPPGRDLRDRSLADADSSVTEAVIEEVRLWQGRPLEELYPIVYLDALMVKVRDEGRIQNSRSMWFWE
jgi:putative transposase